MPIMQTSGVSKKLDYSHRLLKDTSDTMTVLLDFWYRPKNSIRNQISQKTLLKQC